MRIPGSLSLSLSLSLLHWRREREERSEGVGPGWVQPPRLSFPTTRDTIWVPCRMCTVRTAGWMCTLRTPAGWRPRHPAGVPRVHIEPTASVYPTHPSSHALSYREPTFIFIFPGLIGDITDRQGTRMRSGTAAPVDQFR